MEIPKRSFASQQRSKGRKWHVVNYTCGKKPEACFFFQQTRKQNSYTQNPYIFDTFDIDVITPQD